MYSEKEVNEIFESIIDDISNGSSLRKSLRKIGIANITFYNWIDNSEEKAKQYARACEERAEALVDEALEIADNSKNDIKKVKRGNEEVEIVDNEAIQRSKLRFEARQWLAGKLKPKKYGNKLDITSDNKQINLSILTIDPLNDTSNNGNS